MKKFTWLLIFFFTNSFSHGYTPCEEGFADIYACNNIDLLSRVHIDHMGGGVNDSGSDIWGWTDPETSKEYALVGMSYGTTFVDISHPKEPIYLGVLPTATSNSIWRDIKTYNNYAYIVSEANDHGVQIFDLTQLRNIESPPIIFSQTNRYTRVGSIHNIVINEQSGFAYVVGGRDGNEECNSGLHMMDLSDPVNPAFAGCFADDGYTHDAQCVIYHGDDTQYLNQEICFNANEDTVTIVDVSNKQSPVMVSRTGYSNSQYTHQGWLTEDHRYYLMNDELDEQTFSHNTKTYIWDLFDLDSPQLIGFYIGPQPSIDHNIYINGNYAYLSNYTSGLSIVDIKDIGQGLLQETASFDTFPDHNRNNFDGVWSNYPFFESGNVIVSDDKYGLFILQPKLCPVLDAPISLSAIENGENSIKLDWNNELGEQDSYSVYRSEGGCDVDNFELIASDIKDAQFIDQNVTGIAKVGYKVVLNPGSNNDCESKRSQCIETKTSGYCSIAPKFNGIISAVPNNQSSCGINIGWAKAESYCNNDVSYEIYRSTDPNFTASQENRVASNIIGEVWSDSQTQSGQNYFYQVRSRDVGNNSIDNNQVKQASVAQGELENGTWFDGAEVSSKSIKNNLKHLGWEFESSESFEGQRSYWSQNSSNLCNSLESPPLRLTDDKISELSFWTKYDIDTQLDGGVVEVTSQDLSIWNPVSPDPIYPNFFAPSSNQCGYEPATPAFTGTNLNWELYTVDLSDYQGEEIKLRWNYSSNSNSSFNNGLGWFIDNIEVTNTQLAGECSTTAVYLQPGFWFDPARSGHGFVIEPIGRDNLYFIVFYTYKDDGTPEWFTSLAEFKDGTLNLTMDNNSLIRSIRDSDNDLTLNDPNFTNNQIQINFNNDSVIKSSSCNDGINRSQDSAVTNWIINGEEFQWCIQPLISENSLGSPDIGGTWWAGSKDSGWGLSLAVSNELLVASVYFFDESGEPRWVLGSSENFVIGEETTLTMQQFEGFARTSETIAIQSIDSGILSLKINNNGQLTPSGEMTLDLEYKGIEGGVWQRSSIPIEIFTEPH